MLVSRIEAKVREIRAQADGGDYEVAHSMQDEMYEEVLLEIARTAGPRSRAGQYARAAIQARSIKFERKCA